MIGHTQPRRLAARTVAERVAEELGTPSSASAVGYTVRFTDQVGDGTLVKLMTDGILLAELQRDRMLRRYDTLIIDEAHERSLNIDFILGYLAQLLPRRPDLKVIVTSATIDTERFSAALRRARRSSRSPGRTYPVEVRYRPIVDPEDPDATPTATRSTRSPTRSRAAARGPGRRPRVPHRRAGDPRHRRRAGAPLDLRRHRVLPLYARLSAAEQHRVFEPAPRAAGSCSPPTSPRPR